MASELRIMYATFADEDEALAISRALVEERLIACANILGPVRSIYRWQGEIADEGEVAVLMKTHQSKAKAAMARIAEMHSYDTPGIEVWSVEDTPAAFADWVKDETER